jgi:hypothetical protein
LNATQAYDVTPSGITLASALGTLVDKDVVVKDGLADYRYVSIGFTVTNMGATSGGIGAEKANAGRQESFGMVGGGMVGGGNGVVLVLVTSKKNAIVENARKKKTAAKPSPPYTPSPVYPTCANSTANFQGTADLEGGSPIDVSNKSKATNPNTVFYGGIPVGTGDYKKWQGKYAVLKINTSTGKCVLRIYDA